MSPLSCAPGQFFSSALSLQSALPSHSQFVGMQLCPSSGQLLPAGQRTQVSGHEDVVLSFTTVVVVAGTSVVVVIALVVSTGEVELAERRESLSVASLNA